VPCDPPRLDASRLAQESPQIRRFVEKPPAGAQRIVGICSGGYILAAAGLLGKRATTHWNCAACHAVGLHRTLEVLARLPGAHCVLAATSGSDIQADGGMAFTGIKPSHSVERAALLCVPDRYGTVAAMEDQAYLRELRRLAIGARYVTSVCTGSLLLAAAGLLRGKRAACHWAWRHLRAEFGALLIQRESGRRACWW
jgi:transcriptional regulator GlxA family with amidase domain